MKVSTAFTSPFVPNASAFSNAASTSSGFRMSSDTAWIPSFCPSERSSSYCAALLTLLPLRAIATLSRLGTMRLSIPRRSPINWGAYIVVPVDQIGDDSVILCIQYGFAIFDADVLSFNVAKLRQPLPEHVEPFRIGIFGGDIAHDWQGLSSNLGD